MPSTSAKQHRFMEAIAHNKSFAKKVGVPQSVGKDFAAADKGKKFAAGGMARIGKQDTRHGKTDLPFTKLNRFSGMKAGGSVRKVKRFAAGGIDEDTRKRALEYAERNQMGMEPEFNLPASSKSAAKPAAKSRATAASREDDDGRSLGSFKTDREKAAENEGERHLRSVRAPTPAARSTPSGETESGAVTGRTMKIKPRISTDSPEYEKQREQLLDVGTSVLGTMAGPGMAGVAAKGIQAANAARAAQIASVAKHRKLVEMGNKGRAAQSARRAERKAEDAYDAKRASDMEAGYKKGGNVKESKAMVKKEVSFMKKKGAPASMVKHEAAEMGAMKKGGMMRSKKDIAADQMAMAPYKKGGAMKMARGGGIESKGKTKGTMIKMAGGGYVRAADGCATKGKTKGKMV
jgi:hypothetical protein